MYVQDFSANEYIVDKYGHFLKVQPGPDILFSNRIIQSQLENHWVVDAQCIGNASQAQDFCAKLET